MNLITIKIFNTESEAFIYKNALENEGIVCFLFHTHTSSIYPIFNYSSGGIELKVSCEDAAKAESIIAKLFGG